MRREEQDEDLYTQGVDPQLRVYPRPVSIEEEKGYLFRVAALCDDLWKDVNSQVFCK
jgi:hypothetical protein